ncbi:hypothetical protein A3D77_06845 [Candidatus Gottesmanbacteria bacterium RIFCSPHIGHO2_02_FULL_39_11]|uniref:DNA ligase D 3'-phosphoesterase domain-containing protein n=1 Tax=Candidatus Gottesmanbacteria bacterium RIFCSPHIGHO2_02_FULL_39_11 TaxID=1798382 RepID=A0A1F5ZJR5_9BACT|nr:MAG: hypothetical protein A3D77_06845 [Candidatus Gottesmanbacteria bacterium RIFCSPHIGHO2_02_FULL_39_11]
MKQTSIIDESSDDLVFVIHKHQATRLHYDFRLQVGMTMPSWVVPKGPTLDPSLKRLAMQVNDHTLEYRKFEGVIPPGSVGAGPVMIWDYGTYIPEIETKEGREKIEDKKFANEVMRKGMEKGEIKFFLKGEKLKGSFALVRTRMFGSKPAWLLIKHKDEFVQIGYDAKNYDFSAVSGLSLDEIMKKNKAT